MFKGGYVYMVTNQRRTVLYIGVTADITKRTFEHREHVYKGSFTDRYNLERLVYYEFFDSIEQAIEREKQLKRWSRIKKEVLINNKNPSWEDLGEKLFEGDLL